MEMREEAQIGRDHDQMQQLLVDHVERRDRRAGGVLQRERQRRRLSGRKLGGWCEGHRERA